MADDFSIFKEEVKARVDIVDIVGEYLELKRRGSNLTGLCPFHNEKTPSFSVNPAGQFYHCFGCGKGGDVIGFLMDITGMSFMETMEQLASRVGMEMPETRAADPAVRDRKDRIMAANMMAAEYFHTTLSSKEGKQALDYLTGRGLTEATIRDFRLGYAPESAEGLLAFAGEKGISVSELDDAGIISKGSFGRPHYSRFGGRVIFPIVDQNVRIIGFGGRLLEGEGAKYINTPETMIYRKSFSLFGIHQAKDAIKRSRQAIVVEGYMDVISLHQAGIDNVIAASGTSFTRDQGRVIARMARNAILLFDGDPAGLAAAARGADNLLSTDLSIGVVILPEGHDPDSFVREKGAGELRTLIDSPMDIWELKIRVFAGESPDVDDRIRLAGEIADSIARIEDDIKRDVYVSEMSARIKVDRNAMLKAVEGRRRRLKRRGDRNEPDIRRLPGSPAERDTLANLIRHPHLARMFMEEAGTQGFHDPVVRRVAEELFHRTVEGLDCSPSGIMSGLEDTAAQELASAVSMLSYEKYESNDREKSEKHREERAAKQVRETLNTHLREELRSRIASISAEINSETDRDRKEQLINRRRELQTELVDLGKKTNH